MQKKSRANLVDVLVVFFVSVFISIDIQALDHGEWKTVESGFAGRGRTERWTVFRNSSEAYRVKCGIEDRAKPDGNILVAKIARRTVPFDKQKIVLRSSMYPFGQINRAYDSIDLADILLGDVTSKELKTKVFLYNKLCALETSLGSAKRAPILKKVEKMQAVLAIKKDLALYRESIINYADRDLADDIKIISDDRLQVKQLVAKIKNLRTSIMPLLKNYITNLQDYFLKIHSIVENSITLNGLSIGMVARERIGDVLAICGDEKTYDSVIYALKQVEKLKDNAHRLVHSEDMLLYRIMHSFPDYRPILICIYFNMCQDCEQIVSMFANIRNGGDGLVVVSEKENPGEKDVRSMTESLVKKIKLPN